MVVVGWGGEGKCRWALMDVVEPLDEDGAGVERTITEDPERKESE